MESDHDSLSDNKSDKEDTLNVEVHHPEGVDDIDDEDNAPKEDGDKAVGEPEDGESTMTADPTSQLEGEEHDNQITSVDDVSSQPDVDANPETVPAEERPSEEVPAKERPSKEVPAEKRPSEEVPAEKRPSEEVPAEKRPSEEVLAEKKPSKEVPTQEKIINQDMIDVNLSSDDHQRPNPDVALSKAKLHEYLESKGLQYQMLPAESGEEKDPQSLEAILNEYTALDILDEDNKFICKTCTENCEFTSLTKHIITYIYLMVIIRLTYCL